MRRQILLTGKDVEVFLQQLTTNDIRNANEKLVYSLFLTPQGKLLHDVFIIKVNDMFVLDCYVNATQDILTFLNKYKLGSKVELCIADKLTNLSKYDDPRHEKFGKYLSSNDVNIYYELCYPQLYVDFDSGQYFPFEVGFDGLHSISYNKGCYVGQEVITRTHFRGVVRKKVYKMRVWGELNDNENREIFCENQKIGVLLGYYGKKDDHVRYLALMNSELLNQSLEKSHNISLSCGIKVSLDT